MFLSAESRLTTSQQVKNWLPSDENKISWTWKREHLERKCYSSSIHANELQLQFIICIYDNFDNNGWNKNILQNS